MGRDRKRLLDQSQNKPKIRKDKGKEGVDPQWWRFDVPNPNKKGSLLFLCNVETDESTEAR